MPPVHRNGSHFMVPKPSHRGLSSFLFFFFSKLHCSSFHLLAICDLLVKDLAGTCPQHSLKVFCHVLSVHCPFSFNAHSHLLLILIYCSLSATVHSHFLMVSCLFVAAAQKEAEEAPMPHIPGATSFILSHSFFFTLNPRGYFKSFRGKRIERNARSIDGAVHRGPAGNSRGISATFSPCHISVDICRKWSHAVKVNSPHL